MLGALAVTLALVGCGDDLFGAPVDGQGGAEACRTGELVDCDDGQHPDCGGICTGSRSRGWLSHGITNVVLAPDAPSSCADGCPGKPFATLAIGLPRSADCIAVRGPDGVSAAVFNTSSPTPICDTGKFEAGCHTWELPSIENTRRLVIAAEGEFTDLIDVEIAMWAGECFPDRCDNVCLR